jgi:hypothetical protein
MALWDVFFGSNSASDLNFDDEEGTDLKLHVRQEIRRFAILNNKIDTVIRMLLLSIVLLVLNGTLDMRAILTRVFVG